jgi:hypothetical protein
MDDTTLISRNKYGLEYMLQICKDFYIMNDIKANPKKYELIKINSTEKELIIDQQLIEKVNHPIGNRFLGIFFHHKNKRKIYVEKITSIAKNFVQICNWKQLTEKQAIYIWNTVFIPRIEYQLAVVVLTKKECNKIMGIVNSTIKHKGCLSKSTSNAIIYDEDIYKVKNIYYLQLENLIKTMTYYANNDKELKSLFELNRVNSQYKAWTSLCILEEQKLLNFGKYSFINDALMILGAENIKWCNHELYNQHNNHRILGGIIPIENIVTTKEYRKMRESLKKRNILFLDQMIDQTKNNILKWSHFIKENNGSLKGKQPDWYEIIKKKVTKEENSRELKDIYKLNTSEQNRVIGYKDRNFKIGHDKSILSWNSLDNEIIFSKYKKKSQSKDPKKTQIGYHLIPYGNNVDENESPFLKQCTGCNQNIIKKGFQNKEDCCLIYINVNSSRVIPYRNIITNEEKFIKPFESLSNSIIKNENYSSKVFIDEEEGEDVEYNEVIDDINNKLHIEAEDLVFYENIIEPCNREIRKIRVSTIGIILRIPLYETTGKFIWDQIIFHYDQTVVTKRFVGIINGIHDEEKLIIMAILIFISLIPRESILEIFLEKSHRKVILDFLNANERKKYDFKNVIFLKLLKQELGKKGKDLRYKFLITDYQHDIDYDLRILKWKKS